MLDALTGCETVSCFAGHGQKKTWAVWTALRELTRHSVFSPLHRIILMKMPCTPTVKHRNRYDEARHKLFAKESNVQLIPPTSVALEQHSRRAVYQGRHVWARHQHCHHRPTGVGSRPAACMNLSDNATRSIQDLPEA